MFLKTNTIPANQLKKIIEINKNKVVSDETRHKLSVAAKNMSDDIRRKIGNANLGKVVTQQTKFNLSILNSEYIYEKYTKKGEFVKSFDDMYDALKSIGKSTRSNCIYNNYYNKTKTAGGFVWK